MVSVLGFAFIFVTTVLLLVRRDLLPWVLSAAVALTATAGLTIAGQSLVMYPVVATVIVAAELFRVRLRGILGASLSARVGLGCLIAFGTWTVAVTIIAPVAFQGLEVLDPRDGIDESVVNPATLEPQISNLAQCGYLAIGIATVVALGSSGRCLARIPALGFAVGTVLSSLRFLLPDGLQKTLFDNSENIEYTAGEFDGVERMRGIFSEPSALGAFSVAAVVFFVMTASSSKGAARVMYLVLAGWALTNAILSFSGGALVTGIVVLVVVGLRAAIGYVRGRTGFSSITVVLTALALPALFVVGPSLYSFVSLLFSDKADSTSYENRSAADDFSIALSQQTFGVGVGVGSNRPSSFFASLLSTTGVLGVILFSAALALILFRALRDPRFHPVVWSLIAIVISKIVAGPDVADPPMWFLLAVCANGAWRPALYGDQAGNAFGTAKAWLMVERTRRTLGSDHSVRDSGPVTLADSVQDLKAERL